MTLKLARPITCTTGLRKTKRSWTVSFRYLSNILSILSTGSQRPEDKEQVVEALVQQFCDHIEDVIDLYPFAQRINADQPAGTVFECIDSVLVQPLSEQPQI